LVWQPFYCSSIL